MQHHIIKSLAALVMGAFLLLTAFQCGSGWDEEPNLIIGTWSNTAQSYDITIAGQQSIPADAITMEFTADSVRISDMRCNCLPRWEHYTLTTENGKQILHVEWCAVGSADNGIHGGGYVVEELTSSKMVLASTDPNIDMNFMYTMKRR